MFKHKPTYSTEELSQMVQQIKDLNHLRDQSIQKSRLYTNDRDRKSIYDAEADRYSIEISTANRCYQKMLEKIEREK